MPESIFNVDPEVFGPKHGYPPDRNPFIHSRFGYSLNTDLMTGLKNAVDSNQNSLALQYVRFMFEIIEELLNKEEEEEAISSSPPVKTTSTKTAAKVASETE